MNKYVLSNCRPMPEGFRRALAWLEHVAGGRPAGLVVRTKGMVFGSDIDNELGDDAARALYRGRDVMLSGGTALRILSMHGQRPGSHSGPIAIFYPESDLLAFAERISNVTHALAIPHTADVMTAAEIPEISGHAGPAPWTRTWGAPLRWPLARGPHGKSPRARVRPDR